MGVPLLVVPKVTGPSTAFNFKTCQAAMECLTNGLLSFFVPNTNVSRRHSVIVDLVVGVVETVFAL